MARPLQPAFTAGELSPALYARVDLARYQTGLRTLRNFFVRPQGGVSNRAGTRFLDILDPDSSAILIPFVFSTLQAYALVFDDGTLTVYAGDTLITTLATPYAQADLASLRYAQSADVLTVVHPNFPQYELRRLSVSSFTFIAVKYNDGPFLDLNEDTSYRIHASAERGAVTLTCTRSLFVSDHIGVLLYLEARDLANTPPWEPGGIIVRDVSNSLGALRRSDGKVYKCVTDQAVTSGQIVRSGSVRPVHEKGVMRDGSGRKIDSTVILEGVEWEYQYSSFGIARITAVASGVSATATVLKRLPDEVVGGATTTAGPWTMTGDGIDKTLTTGAAFSNKQQDYEVTFDGVIQPAEAYVVSPLLITFYSAPAIGVAVSARETFINNRTELWALGAWGAHQGYPSLVTYFQDRLVFAASRERPQTVWASKNGDYPDFGISLPSADDDGLSFTMNARQINIIRDLVPLDKLIALTSAGAWKITDGQNEVLTPSTVGFKPQSYRGSKALRSVMVGDEAVYVQDAGRKVRTLGYRYETDKFAGVNLSILANHLLRKANTVIDMAYADEPHTLLHVVRSDGEMPVLTYEAEQDVIAWAHWDTQGVFESVCCVPADGDTEVYVIVRRTVSGLPVRYLERFAPREIDTILDGVFVDCSLSFDGRGNGTTTMTLTGSSWNQGDTLTCTTSLAAFVALTPPDQVVLQITEDDEDAEEQTYRVRCDFVSFTSTTVITVRAVSDVPTPLQGVAVTAWSIAFNSFSGLGHLEGKTVAIAADGSVEPQQTVVSGAVTLEHPASVVHVGLPYECDLETLDINIQGAETVRDLTKNIAGVTFITQETRGLMAGPDAEHLNEYTVREFEDYDAPADYLEEAPYLYITNTWNKHGRVFVRQADPLPITILGVIPGVEFGPSG